MLVVAPETSWSLVHRIPTARVCLTAWDLEASKRDSLGPVWDVAPQGEKNRYSTIYIYIYKYMQFFTTYFRTKLSSTIIGILQIRRLIVIYLFIGLPFSVLWSLSTSTDEGGGGGGGVKAGRNYRGPEVRNGDRGPIIFHMFLSFSIMSTVIRYRFVVLTSFAGSCHLAQNAVCSVSLLFAMPVRPYCAAWTRSRKPCCPLQEDKPCLRELALFLPTGEFKTHSVLPPAGPPACIHITPKSMDVPWRNLY
jgi:hypothetical protein